MTLTSGSSGGGSSSNDGGSKIDRSPTKNKTASQSKGTGVVTYGTTDAKAHEGSSNESGYDYQKGRGSLVAGTGAPKITPANTSIVGGASSTPAFAHPGSTSDGGGSGGSRAVDTTVTQKPAAGGGSTEGPEGTVVTAGPRSDFSVVLAGQVGRRPDRSPSRSNNFSSFIGGAGGLGRRTSEAKRSLIGGA